MDVRSIDASATSGRSALHRASPLTKLAALALVLAAVVVQSNVLVVTAIGLAVAAVAIGSRLPARAVFALAAYPGLFAAVFALAAAPDVLAGSLFVAKAVTAALAAVTLVFTTPYPQVFAPVQMVVPGIVGDAMLMTYRSLFLLADKLDRLRIAVRLRSGLRAGHPVRTALATVSVLGPLVLYSFDLAQREYDVMRLRGYEGRIRTRLPSPARPAFDASLLMATTALLALAVVFRLAGPALTPYSWMPPAGGLLLLAASTIWRLIRR